jgi:hypothetical protein
MGVPTIRLLKVEDGQCRMSAFACLLHVHGKVSMPCAASKARGRDGLPLGNAGHRTPTQRRVQALQ